MHTWSLSLCLVAQLCCQRLVGAHPKPLTLGARSGRPISEDAPICRENEPCGWYKFTSSAATPVKWIPSWCQCDERNEQCVFEEANGLKKTYRHTCQKKDISV